MSSATWNSAAAAATVLLVAVLLWPLPLHLDTHLSTGAFTAGHTWALGHIARMVLGDLPLSVETTWLGYPDETKAQFLGWLPAVVMAPVSLLASPLVAYNLTLWLSPAVATLAAAAWLRQATRAEPEVVAAAAFSFGTSAYVLSNVGAGNIDKLQVWFYPAWLALAWWALQRERGWALLPVFVAFGTAMAFTEPYFALFLPLFATPLLLAHTWGHWRRGALGVAMVGASGLGMLPAKLYYANDGPLDMTVLFSHSVVTRHTTPPPLQEPVASLENLLLGPLGEVPSPVYNVHACAIGLGVLLVALALIRRPAPGRGTGWLLAALGLVLASGPQLMLGGQWRLDPTGSMPFYLPMELLEQLGYPLAKGGQYYRAAPLVGLGVLTALCAGLAGHPRRRPLAAIAVAATLGQAIGASGPFWPRPIEPVHAPWIDVMADLGEPDDAVAALPLHADQRTNELRSAHAALHRKPAAIKLRHIQMPEMLSHFPWALGMGMQGVAGYHDAEIAFVVLYKGEDDQADPPWLRRDAQQEMLGAPVYEDDDVVIFEVRPGAP